MTSPTTPNQKQDGVQDLRTKLVVYMSFYVEARDAQDAQEMAKWVDKLERLISDTVKSEVNKVLDDVQSSMLFTIGGEPLVPLSAIEQVRKEWNP